MSSRSANLRAVPAPRRATTRVVFTAHSIPVAMARGAAYERQLEVAGAHVAGDGRSHWFKGVQLVAVYLIIALMFYLVPAAR